MEEKRVELVKLAKDILKLSRNTLLVNLRFLDMALSMFELVPINTSTIMTDGKHLLYNPKFLLKEFKDDKQIITRDYLHIVFHCIYRHMFVSATINRRLWNLACDIAVENCISELGLKGLCVAKEQKQWQYLTILKTKINILTAEKIYAHLQLEYTSEQDLQKLEDDFLADDHSIWYESKDETEQKHGLTSNKSQSDSNDDGENNNNQEPTSDNGENNNQQSALSPRVISSQELEEQWQ